MVSQANDIDTLIIRERVEGFRQLMGVMGNPVACSFKIKALRDYPLAATEVSVSLAERAALAFDQLNAQFKRMQYWNLERKLWRNRSCLLFGTFELAPHSIQPHFHLVVDFGSTTHHPTIMWCARQAYENVKRANRSFVGSPHVELNRTPDDGWLEYMCKSPSSLLFVGA